jgi:hypothetical protein
MLCFSVNENFWREFVPDNAFSIWLVVYALKSRKLQGLKSNKVLQDDLCCIIGLYNLNFNVFVQNHHLF